MELILKIRLNNDSNREIVRKFLRSCMTSEAIAGDELLPCLRGNFYIGAATHDYNEAQFTLMPDIE